MGIPEILENLKKGNNPPFPIDYKVLVAGQFNVLKEKIEKHAFKASGCS